MQTARSCLLAIFALAVSACGGSTSEDPGTGGGAGTGGAPGSGGVSGGGSGGGGIEDFCYYEGKQYYPSAIWTSSDGCNTCMCSEWGGIVSCSKQACPVTCEHNGKTYQVGDSFPAGDGCNSCTCEAGGEVSCTLVFCAPTCVYAGKEYVVGDTFTALDGCNKCTCTDQGVSCTELACACDPAKEWWRNYIGKSAAECTTIKYTCTGYTTPFANACGCGCEQDSSCPPTISCMPPAPSCDELKAKCPFSGVEY